MQIKTLLKLFLRGTALWTFVNAFTSFLMLIAGIISVSHDPDTPYGRTNLLYINLAHAVIWIVTGVVLYKYSERLTILFGKDFDFTEKIEVVKTETLIAGAYAVIGIWLIVFSIPALASEIIRFQTGYFSSSTADKYSAILKYSIVEDTVKIIVGTFLVRFRKWLPPFSSEAEGEISGHK